jgi:hypothetical protein
VSDCTESEEAWLACWCSAVDHCCEAHNNTEAARAGEAGERESTPDAPLVENSELECIAVEEEAPVVCALPLRSLPTARSADADRAGAMLARPLLLLERRRAVSRRLAVRRSVREEECSEEGGEEEDEDEVVVVVVVEEEEEEEDVVVAEEEEEDVVVGELLLRAAAEALCGVGWAVRKRADGAMVGTSLGRALVSAFG